MSQGDLELLVPYKSSGRGATFYTSLIQDGLIKFQQWNVAKSRNAKTIRFDLVHANRYAVKLAGIA